MRKLLLVLMLVAQSSLAGVSLASPPTLAPIPQDGTFNNNDAYFNYWKKYAINGAVIVDGGIKCEKLNESARNKQFRTAVASIITFAIQSYGDNKGNLSIKGAEQLSTAIIELNTTYETQLLEVNKDKKPSADLCLAFDKIDLSNLN